MNIINIILSSLITAIFMIIIISNLSKTKINFKIIVKFVLILVPILILIYSFFEGVSRLLLNIILIIISSYFTIFDKNISKSVYYAFVYEMIVFLVEIIMSIIFVSILKFDLNSYESFSFSLLIFSIINSVVVCLISKIKFIKNSIIRLNDKINKNNKEWFYIIIVIILTGLLIVLNGANLQNNLSFYINAGMVIFIFVTLIYVVYNKLQNSKLEDKYNQMMDYVSKYEKIINEQGKKNHEYNNQLMVLKGYVSKPDKLKEYLDIIISEHKGGQNYTIKQLGYFPDGGIKGLIYHKLSKMEENEVKPYLYIDQNIKDIFEEKFDINTYRDITKLLGVFLDNAIEAAKDADEKEVEIDIKNKDGYILIVISNTFNNNVDVSQVGKKGFSTKGTGHGFGLSIVKDISKNNNNIDTFSDVNNNKFKQTIMIYYKK